MEDAELRQKIEELQQRIDAVYVSAEKTRKYFLWGLMGTVVMFVLPLIGLFFAIPSFIGTYTQLGGLN